VGSGGGCRRVLVGGGDGGDGETAHGEGKGSMRMGARMWVGNIGKGNMGMGVGSMGRG
jgi:hypothetical protein